MDRETDGQCYCDDCNHYNNYPAISDEDGRVILSFLVFIRLFIISYKLFDVNDKSLHHWISQVSQVCHVIKNATLFQ